MKVISQQIVPYGVAEPVYPLDISTAMATAIQSAMTGNQSVADALATADQTINQTIQTQQLKGTQPQS
jgi:multiple sugar transport system substrate-binding protein